MQLNFPRSGTIVVAAALLVVSACGTPSQSQTQAGNEGRASSASQADDAVVATIGETEITLAELDANVLASNLSVFQQLYEARREALGELVAHALLEQEAQARGVSQDELVAEEITSQVAPVTDADVEAFFEQNRARLGGQSLEQIGGQIREYLEARNEALARQAFIDGLREDANVEIGLEPPRVPVVVADNERIKGPEDAPVTIVEYSDFQ